MSGAVRSRAVKPLASLSASLLGRRDGVRRVPLSFARVPEEDVLLEEPALDEAPAAEFPDNDGLPEVQLQLARLARALAVEDAPEAPEPAEEPIAFIAPEPRRVAFTLRLDPLRHARLRALAVAQGCSAQVVLTRMLDETIQESTIQDPAGGAASDATVLPLKGVQLHGKQP